MKKISYIKKTIKKRLFNYLIKENNSSSSLSIISSNCIGTRIYQSKKQIYTSPTINLWFSPTDFIKLTNRLEYYMTLELVEYNDITANYPKGILGDIIINFQHYETFNEAKEKWEKRKKRINFNHILLLFTDRDGATYQDLNNIIQHPLYPSIVFCDKSKKNKVINSDNVIFIKSDNNHVNDLYSNYDELLFKFPYKKVKNHER